MRQMLRQASLTGFRTENSESIQMITDMHHRKVKRVQVFECLTLSETSRASNFGNHFYHTEVKAELKAQKKAWMRRNTQSIRTFWQKQLPTATWGNMKQRVRPIYECMCFFLTTFWSLELSPSGIPTWSNGQTLPKTWHGFSSNSARLGFIFTLSLAPIKAMTLGRQWPEQLHKQAGYIHTYIHTCIHTYIHTYKHTNIQTYKHTNIQTYKHTNIH